MSERKIFSVGHIQGNRIFLAINLELTCAQAEDLSKDLAESIQSLRNDLARRKITNSDCCCIEGQPISADCTVHVHLTGVDYAKKS